MLAHCARLLLPSARQHLSYGVCLEVKREYYQNSSVLDCVTQCSQSAAHLCEQFLQVRLGISHWDPYAVHRGGCLELYYCNTMEWFWWDSSLISTTSWFLQCFDTVGLVIWPVKIVPDMTHYVSSGTLNPTHSLNHLCKTKTSVGLETGSKSAIKCNLARYPQVKV